MPFWYQSCSFSTRKYREVVQQSMSYKHLFERQITWFSQECVLGEGGTEEFRHQSRECQELSAAAAGHQLIFKMSSEHQTVDHTNKLTGNDHDTILVRFRTACSTA